MFCFNIFFQEFVDSLFSEAEQTTHKIISHDCLQKYIAECIKLCLLMTANDPPLVLECPGWPEKSQEKPTLYACVTNNTETTSAVTTDEQLMCNERKSDPEDTDIDRPEDSEGEKGPTDGTALETETDTRQQEEKKYLQSTSGEGQEKEVFSNAAEENTVTVSNSSDFGVATEGQTIISGVHPNTDAVSDSYELTVRRQEMVASDDKRQNKNWRFEKSKFKDYTKRGMYIDFVVWPVMLLHKDGPVLCRGVAQGTD